MVFGAVCPVPLGTPALAQSVVVDPNRGRGLAQSLCSICHGVDPSLGNAQNLKSPELAPSLTGWINVKSMAAAIIFPHPAMPTVSFTNTELRDGRYIMSLKEQKPATE